MTGDDDGDGIPDHLDNDDSNDGMPDDQDTDDDGVGIPVVDEGVINSSKKQETGMLIKWFMHNFYYQVI